MSKSSKKFETRARSGDGIRSRSGWEGSCRGGVPQCLRGAEANPTVRGIQQLGKNSIQTHRDKSDVLRHIIKNVSKRLIRIIEYCVL